LSQTPSASPRLLHRLQRGLARLAEAESEGGLLRVLDELLQELPGIACAMLTVVDHLGVTAGAGAADADARSRTWLLALPAGGPCGAVAARAALRPLPPIEFPIRPGLSGMLCVHSDPTQPRAAALDAALVDALRIVTLTLGAHLARVAPAAVVQPAPPGRVHDFVPRAVEAGRAPPRSAAAPRVLRSGLLPDRQQFLRIADAHLNDAACVEATLLRVEVAAPGGAVGAVGTAGGETGASLRTATEALGAVLPEGLPAACLRSGELAVLLAPALLRVPASPPALASLERQVQAALSARARELGLKETCTSAQWPRDGVDAAALLRHARAESLRPEATDAAWAEERDERVSMESELRQLVLSGSLGRELRVVYQPQVSLADMRLCGVEALLRWRSPRFGEVAPAVFVPILEETGLIVPVGEWMLRQAAAQTRAWAGQGLRVRRLAVNLTLSQLRAAATVRALEQVLVDSDGLAGCQLEVEVTESTLMSDAEGMGELLRTLTGLGVRIAVDDFGRGTCALGWLESFPISGIKVDPLFLGELDANPDHAQLARAMFDLGRALNLRVSAEGVETASQLAFIRSNGCEEAQGFYLARPLEAEHFLAGASQTFH
jgi:EAL domain-containing protein (putative c-di-GMP-specific phosphodiesterase class I)